MKTDKLPKVFTIIRILILLLFLVISSIRIMYLTSSEYTFSGEYHEKIIDFWIIVFVSCIIGFLCEVYVVPNIKRR